MNMSTVILIYISFYSLTLYYNLCLYYARPYLQRGNSMNHLKKYRETARFLQKDLAELVRKDLSITLRPSTMAGYENTPTNPPLHVCRSIVRIFNAHHLKCTIEEVFPEDLEIKTYRARGVA